MALRRPDMATPTEALVHLKRPLPTSGRLRSATLPTQPSPGSGGPQDAPDIAALAHQIGLGKDPSTYADLLERISSGEGALQAGIGRAR